MANNIPITTGVGTASVATETVGGISYQLIEVYGGGGASVLAVNPDGSFKASIIGVPTITFSGAPSVSGTLNVSVLGGTIGVSGTPNIQGKDAPTSSITGSPIYIAGKDANASIAGIQVIGGAVLTVGSVSGSVGVTGNPSISGTINVGNTVTINSPSVYGNISGSVAAIQNGTWNASITSTVPSSVIVGASIFGALPAGNAIIGAVAASISGTVATTLSGTPSVSGTVNVSILGGTIGISGTAAVTVTGSVLTLQAPVASIVSGVTSMITGTAGVSVLSAAPGGQRNYVTNILVTNQQTSVTGAGAQVNIIDDGSGNVMYAGYAAAGGGGFALSFPTPLRQPTSTFSISAKSLTQASILAAMSGYTGL